LANSLFPSLLQLKLRPTGSGSLLCITQECEVSITALGISMPCSSLRPSTHPDAYGLGSAPFPQEKNHIRRPEPADGIPGKQEIGRQAPTPTKPGRSQGNELLPKPHDGYGQRQDPLSLRRMLKNKRCPQRPRCWGLRSSYPRKHRKPVCRHWQALGPVEKQAAKSEDCCCELLWVKLLLITTGTVLSPGRTGPSYARAAYSRESQVTVVKSMSALQVSEPGFYPPSFTRAADVRHIGYPEGSK